MSSLSKQCFMPEYVVPYVYHLLAHHPDFPTEKEDAKRIRAQQKHLSWFLDPLVKSLGNEADNVAFLMQLTDKISAEYVDAIDINSEHLCMLAALSKRMLQKQIRTESQVRHHSTRE